MGKKLKRSKEQKIALQFRRVQNRLSALATTDELIMQHLLLGGRSTASEVATEVQLTSGSMTAAINRLVKLGLVERQRTDLDRRKVYLDLTETGRDAAKISFKAQQKELKKVLKDFTERELALMAGILKRLQD